MHAISPYLPCISPLAILAAVLKSLAMLLYKAAGKTVARTRRAAAALPPLLSTVSDGSPCPSSAQISSASRSSATAPTTSAARRCNLRVSPPPHTPHIVSSHSLTLSSPLTL